MAQVICYCSSSGRYASRTVHYTKNVNINRLSEYINVEEAYQRMKQYVLTTDFMNSTEEIMFSVIAFILQRDIKIDKVHEDLGIDEEIIKKEIHRIREDVQNE